MSLPCSILTFDPMLSDHPSLRGDYQTERTSFLLWLLSAVIAGFVVQNIFGLWFKSDAFEQLCALSPLAPLDAYRSDPAQTRLMPVVPKHEQVKAKTPQGAPAAMAIAKHGSPIMLPPAHGVGNPCTPHVHSLRCPHPYAHNAMLSPWTSLIYNQFEACPLQ